MHSPWKDLDGGVKCFRLVSSQFLSGNSVVKLCCQFGKLAEHLLSGMPKTPELDVLQLSNVTLKQLLNKQEEDLMVTPTLKLSPLPEVALPRQYTCTTTIVTNKRSPNSVKGKERAGGNSSSREYQKLHPFLMITNWAIGQITDHVKVMWQWQRFERGYWTMWLHRQLCTMITLFQTITLLCPR